MSIPLTYTASRHASTPTYTLRFYDPPPLPRKTMTAPLPMILHCPVCSHRHLDEGEFATKPHHTHSCQRCGHTWRPAIEPTVGVLFLEGFHNDFRTAFEEAIVHAVKNALLEHANFFEAYDNRNMSNSEVASVLRKRAQHINPSSEYIPTSLWRYARPAILPVLVRLLSEAEAMLVGFEAVCEEGPERAIVGRVIASIRRDKAELAQ